MLINDLFAMGMDRQIPELLDAPRPEGRELFVGIDLGASGSKRTLPIAIGYPHWEFPRDRITLGTNGSIAEDSSVHALHAFHFLEHLSGADAIALLREAERVLVEGGIMNIVVPYYSSSMQAQDLTHKSCWNEGSMATLLNNPYYDPAGKWKLRVHTQFILGIVERNLALFIQLTKGN